MTSPSVSRDELWEFMTLLNYPALSNPFRNNFQRKLRTTPIKTHKEHFRINDQTYLTLPENGMVFPPCLSSLMLLWLDKNIYMYNTTEDVLFHSSLGWSAGWVAPILSLLRLSSSFITNRIRNVQHCGKGRVAYKYILLLIHPQRLMGLGQGNGVVGGSNQQSSKYQPWMFFVLMLCP